MTTPLRIGVVGSGDVATRDYLPEAGRLLPDAEIVAIASSDGERARRVAAQYGITHACTGYAELLAVGVDVVVNLTPRALHDEVNHAAIAAGCHVYSEKPFATSVDAGRRLLASAQNAGLSMACAPSVMVFPQVQRARELIDAGALGEVWSATGQILGGRPPWEGYESDPTAFFADDCGPLVDIGVYPLHALTGLLGPVSHVSAMSARSQASFTPESGPLAGAHIPVLASDVWHVNLRFAGGAVGAVRSDFATFGTTQSPDIELSGTSGSLSMHLIDMTAPLRTNTGAGACEELMPSPRVEGPDHILGVAHLIECVRTGTPPLLSAEHAIHVIEILQAAVASAADGVTRTLATTFATPSTTRTTSSGAREGSRS